MLDATSIRLVTGFRRLALSFLRPGAYIMRELSLQGEAGATTMTLPDDIYSQRILELAAALPRTERLSAPGASAKAHSKLCGSTVTVDLAMEDGIVTDYGQSVRACLLGQSAASVMGREIIGTSAAELREVGAVMRKMLKEEGPPPQGKWGDLAVLEPVRDYKARHASTLLVFDAVEDAIAQIEAKREDAARAKAHV